MSLDDQLFKQDGTFITWVDIQLLKFSRFVANFFVKEEEETYQAATKRLLRVVIVILAITLALEVLSYNVIMSFVCGLLISNAYRTTRWLSVMRGGQGTNIPNFFKYFNLFLSVLAPIIVASPPYPKTEPSAFITGMPPSIAFGLCMFVYGLTIFYALRLGNMPPKKKKARQLKPALAPQ